MKNLLPVTLFALFTPACLGGGADGSGEAAKGDCRNAALQCADGFECRSDSRGAFECTSTSERSDDDADNRDERQATDPRDGQPGDSGEQDRLNPDGPSPGETLEGRCRTLCSEFASCPGADQTEQCERTCVDEFDNDPSLFAIHGHCATEHVGAGRCNRSAYATCVEDGLTELADMGKTRTCQRACVRMVGCDLFGEGASVDGCSEEGGPVCEAISACHRECAGRQSTAPQDTEEMFACVDQHLTYACEEDAFRACAEPDVEENPEEEDGDECFADHQCPGSQVCDEMTSLCTDTVTSESVCMDINQISAAVGCAHWHIEDCLAEEEGPQNQPLCLEQFSEMLNCMANNTADCYCEEEDNDLNCEPAVKRDEAWNPDGPPCAQAAHAYEECVAIFDRDLD